MIFQLKGYVQATENTNILDFFLFDKIALLGKTKSYTGAKTGSCVSHIKNENLIFCFVLGQKKLYFLVRPGMRPRDHTPKNPATPDLINSGARVQTRIQMPGQ